MAQLTIAPIMLAAPASAVALTVHDTASGHVTTLSSRITPRHVALGRPVQVFGHTAARRAGARVELETARGRGGHWRRLATTRIGRHGGWALHVRLRESAVLRAVEVASAPRRAHASGASSTRLHGGSVTAVSRTTRVQVRAQMRVAARPRSAVAGTDATVAGHLRPARAGRVVAVQAHGSRGWTTVGRARTGGQGGFSVRVRPTSQASARLRVVFAGDRLNAATSRGAGSLRLYTPAVVSWYDDAGSTGCGFHTEYGIANRTLACGTRVHLRHGGRSVTATVDDRGPYVGGREFDLNQNTAAALGFDGVGVVETSIG